MKSRMYAFGLLLLLATAGASFPVCAETHYLEVQSFRLGVDAESGLPVFIGMGMNDSGWIAKNLMAADLNAKLIAPGRCRRISVVEKTGESISTLWQMGGESSPVKIVYGMQGDRIRITFTRSESGSSAVPVALRIPFNPFVTSTTYLSSSWDDSGESVLPGVLVAPDHGAVELTPLAAAGKSLSVRMTGSRDDHLMSLLLQFNLSPGESAGLEISKYNPPPLPGLPAEFSDIVHHAWLNLFQTRAINDTTVIPEPFPGLYRVPQLIANNTLSDPVSFTFFNAADMAFLTPRAHSLSLMEIVKHSVTYWLANNVPAEGAAIGYTEYTKFIDANPSLLISAWDVFEYTQDLDWLKKHIRILEILANYLASRDLDGDGIVEAEVEGTPGRLATGRDRSSNWIDAINFGYKDAFTNALIYRGWRCLAALEKRLGNSSLSDFYSGLAARLKEQYFQSFYDHSTGMIVGWIDKNGRKAPYRFPNVAGLAVACGVVSGERAYEIMANTIKEIEKTGFRNFKYGGVPLTLDPIDPSDYLVNGFGYPNPKLPNKNWQVYQNGGISPTQSAYYLLGLIRAGFKEEAQKILREMLETQRIGGFQNGIINEYPKGGEWKTWDGKPGGYEGFLNDNYYYLIAGPLMDDTVRERLFAPVSE